ncbi:TolC family protein [Desulfoluna sp.]|uniref:TolC family protein n=1 Tax=Desulfoluna sp. TaxID=2045199 RepID=UPI0026089B3B|nr:TolC family protein [Desulfoluna sp.]
MRKGGAMRGGWAGLAWLWVVFGLIGVPCSHADMRRVVVGAVTAGPASTLSDFRASVQRELATLASPELVVELASETMTDGAWTAEGLETAFRALEEDPRVSFGVAMGYVASGVAAQRGHWAKPMLATHLLTRAAEGGPDFHAIVVGPLFRSGLEQFFEALRLDHVTLVVDEHAGLVLPQISDFVADLSSMRGKQWALRIVPARADAMIGAVPEETDGVIFSPFPGLSPEGMAEVAGNLILRKCPSYAMGGRGDVEAGLLFGSEPQGELRRLARRTALTLYSMARGESLGTAREEWSVEGTPLINVATAKAIGFSPAWELFRQADKVGAEAPEPVVLTLSEAMTLARLYNPGLASEARRVEAQAQDVNKALANLVPRIDASVTGLRIDENSAEKSMGTESEESIKGTLTLTQVLYSEAAVSGYSATKLFQRSREAQQQARVLDKALAAGEAYITLLKARSLAAVREGNLGLTQENLARARARKQAGVLNPSELFRWESEVAKNRTELLKIRAQVQYAGNALKRLCGLAVTEGVDVGAGADDQGVLLTSHLRFQEMLDRPTEFDALVATLVAVGWEASPELLQIDHALSAGRRRIKGFKRAFYLPDVALKGGVTEVLDRHGYDQVRDPFEEREWHVAIQASFPLVTGGERLADLRKVAGETAALSLKRRHTMTLLAEKMTDAALAVQVSGATIGLVAASRDAAEKNLALVTDAYSEGAVAVITLLDAQNTAVNARIASENAVYDHMVGVLRLQRLLGQVDLSGDAGKEMVRALGNALSEAGR